MPITVVVEIGDDLAFRLSDGGNTLIPSLPSEREAVRAALRGALDCLVDGLVDLASPPGESLGYRALRWEPEESAGQ
jgi:hypothetical protein